MNAEAADVLMAPAIAPQVDADAFDRTYWVDHCEGYSVESERGRLGLVGAVRKDGEETTIAVRVGMLGRRLLVYSAADVAFIVPRAQMLFLRSSAEPIASEPAPG